MRFSQAVLLDDADIFRRNYITPHQPERRVADREKPGSLFQNDTQHTYILQVNILVLLHCQFFFLSNSLPPFPFGSSL